MTVRARLVENLGIEPRTWAIDRVTAGHAECDRLVSRDLVQEVNAVVISLDRGGEVSFLEQRTGMADRVRLDRQTLLEPRLEPGMIGPDLVGHDAECGPAVDRLEPIQDRAKKRLVP